MNDTDFEQMLRESSPAVTTPVGIDAHQERILAEAGQRRGHRSRRLVAAVGLSVLLVGAGSGALAGFGVQTPWGWVAENAFENTQDDGSRCFQGLRIEYDATVTADSPIVRDAQQILASIDLNALDTSAREAEIKAEEAERAAAAPNWPTMSAAVLKQEAVLETVSEQLMDELEARGYPDADVYGSPIQLYSQSDACGR